MAQILEFSAQQGLTLTANACQLGSYSGGTAATSVAHQAGTDRYLATFATNLAAGTWRLDYLRSGAPIGSEVYDLSGSGTYQPRSEQPASASVTVLPLEAQRQLLAVGSDIYVKVRARSLVGFHVSDASGDAVNLDALNLLITVESLDTLTEHTVVNADIQRSGDSFSFRIPAAVVEAPREWAWSLREVGHDEHLLGGKIYVTYAP